MEWLVVCVVCIGVMFEVQVDLYFVVLFDLLWMQLVVFVQCVMICIVWVGQVDCVVVEFEFCVVDVVVVWKQWEVCEVQWIVVCECCVGGWVKLVLWVVWCFVVVCGD